MLRKAHILLASTILLVALGALASRLYLRLLENQEQQKALYLASNASQAIQQNLVVALSAAKALSPIIDDEGNVLGFERIAPEIFASYEGVASVQLAPKGIVEFVYPLEGNEQVLGLNNFADPERRDESVAVVKGGKLAISGPLTLKQGYTGIIGRYPIYRGNETDIFDRFWGFATVIVSLDKLLEATMLEQLEIDGYRLRLSLLKGGHQANTPFYTSPGFQKDINTVSLSFYGVAKEWSLEIQHLDGWVPTTRIVVVIVTTAIICALLIWILSLTINRRQAQAAQLAQAQKTQYLLSAANTLAELGSWEYDPNSETFTLSQEVAGMLGNQNALIGVLPEVVSHDLNQSHWRSFMLRIQTLSPAMEAVRETVHTADNSTLAGKIFEVHAMALQRPSTKSHTVVGYFRDITKREETSRKLENSLQQLEQANKAKDLLFTVIAHDLRGPAGSLHSIVEMLVDGDLQPAQLDEMRPMLHQSSRSIVNLLDNLLSWSLSQQGTIQISYTKLDIRSVIAEVFSIVEYRATQKHIELTSVVSDDAVEFYSDSTVLNTILRNLVSNAVKFTPKGGRVTVECAVSDQGSSIVVSDTGIGMNERQIQHAFRGDVLVSTSGTDSEQGTGLGLKVCKDLVEKLGGTITIDSEPHKGTTFTLTFPKKD